jgi:hypothetical protein
VEAQTQTRFDFDLWKRSFEAWDLDPLANSIIDVRGRIVREFDVQARDV